MMTNAKKHDHLDPIREQILMAAIGHAPFDGWNQGTLMHAAEEAGVDKGTAKLAFPGGARELLEFFSAWADLKMIAGYEAAKEAGQAEGLGIRGSIKLAMTLRFDAIAPYREAMRRAVTFEALPHNAPSGGMAVYHTVDAAWRVIGDTSTDFNFYTKRAILAAVFGSTLLFWLNDHSDGFADTDAFLERRLDDVMTFGKVRGQVESVIEKLPNPFKLAAGLRFPSRPLKRR